jgi:hypothetical protein
MSSGNIDNSEPLIRFEDKNKMQTPMAKLGTNSKLAKSYVE